MVERILPAWAESVGYESRTWWRERSGNGGRVRSRM